MRRMRSLVGAVVVVGLVAGAAGRARADCVINAFGTQILVGCNDPRPAARWRVGGDDGEATRWRSRAPLAPGRPRAPARRAEELGSRTAEVEPNLAVPMLKVP